MLLWSGVQKWCQQLYLLVFCPSEGGDEGGKFWLQAQCRRAQFSLRWQVFGLFIYINKSLKAFLIHQSLWTCFITLSSGQICKIVCFQGFFLSKAVQYIFT